MTKVSSQRLAAIAAQAIKEPAAVTDSEVASLGGSVLAQVEHSLEPSFFEKELALQSEDFVPGDEDNHPVFEEDGGEPRGFTGSPSAPLHVPAPFYIIEAPNNPAGWSLVHVDAAGVETAILTIANGQLYRENIPHLKERGFVVGNDGKITVS